ncbi:hypothetical protein YC2023_051275 [Brassica napus]
MLLVRACGAETFVPWTLLERAGVQRHTVLATLRIIYPYEEMRGIWTSFMLSPHCLRKKQVSVDIVMELAVAQRTLFYTTGSYILLCESVGYVVCHK